MCKKLADEHKDVELAIDAAVSEAGATIFDKPTYKGGIFAGTDVLGRGFRMVELLCQTDFAANTEAFITAGNTLASAYPPDNVNTILAPLSTKLGESVSIGKTWVYSNDEGHPLHVGFYIHKDRSVGAVVILKAGKYIDDVSRNELAKDLAMQIVATKPAFATIEDVPESQRKALEEDMRIEIAESKRPIPADKIDKVIAGKMNKVYKQKVLMEQTFVKDESLTIKELLATKAPEAKILAYNKMEAGILSDERISQLEQGLK